MPELMGSQSEPFSDHNSLSIASPLAGLVNVTLSALLPLLRRMGFVGSLAFFPSPVNSMTVLVPSSTFTAPLASTLKRKSPRRSTEMKPVRVAVNLPAGRKGVGGCPAGT
jgi:hypothetical protein